MNITNEELLQAYKKEKNTHKKERLHAMCMIKINKYTITETAKVIFCSYQCTELVIYRFEEYKLEGLEDHPRSGSLSLIPRKKLPKIERLFKKLSGGMTPKKLMQFIFDKTGITYHITHVCHLLYGWNLKPKIPQKLHVRCIKCGMLYVVYTYQFTYKKGKRWGISQY